MQVVLDTCALLWLTLDPSELSPRAHKRISEADEILVSSISIWEIGIKVKRSNLRLGMEYPDYVERVAAAADLVLVPVDHLLWLQSVQLDWTHRDPADRVIVSLAKMRGAVLITDDKAIQEFYSPTVG